MAVLKAAGHLLLTISSLYDTTTKCEHCFSSHNANGFEGSSIRHCADNGKGVRPKRNDLSSLKISFICR